MTAVHGGDVVNKPRYREALIEVAVVSNAALSAYTVQHELGGADAHGLRAAYGVWLLESHEVWAPRVGTRDCAGLAFPPADLAAFAAFADAVVQSERIASLLATQGAAAQL